MAKKSRLDSISVPKPCTEDWNEMNGGEKSRFCRICEKNVYNISAMTKREADKLLFGSGGKVCIRMEKDAHGKIKTLKNQLHQITRQAPIAAGVLSATLALSAAALAQGEPFTINPDKVNVVQTAKDDASKPSISGTIYDESGAVIPNVGIKLRNVNNNSVQKAISNNQGDYRFYDLAASVYEIETDEVAGFKKFIAKNIEVSGKNNLQLSVILQVNDTLQVMGDVAILPDEPSEKLTNKIVQTAKSLASETVISGKITDQNDAVVPGMKIILRDTKNNSSQKIVSNDAGFYRFGNVKDSTYEIEVEQGSGFKGFSYKNISVDGKNNLSLNIALESLGEVMGVYAESNTFEIEGYSAKIEEKLNFVEIKELPAPKQKFFLGLTASGISKSSNQTSSVSLTVADMADAVIPGAEALLISQKTKQQFSAVSNKEGIARFSYLPPGKYQLRVSAAGFQVKTVSLELKKGSETKEKLKLDVGVMMGDVVMIEP